ncbi:MULTISPECIES: hypothetical protein, partial [unclassified Limnospira]|uniref:hypothetical protein n=1 Tax=unclassified Limnospira TaxID=2642885 RepID=UPI0028E7DE6A
QLPERGARSPRASAGGADDRLMNPPTPQMAITRTAAHLKTIIKPKWRDRTSSYKANSYYQEQDKHSLA